MISVANKVSMGYIHRSHPCIDGLLGANHDAFDSECNPLALEPHALCFVCELKILDGTLARKQAKQTSEWLSILLGIL